MKKIIKTTFKCDYCSKEFKSPTSCFNHEKNCSKRSADIHRLTCYLDVLIHHYHKQGYQIEIRYSDSFDNELLVDLKLPKN